ncbi:MAG: 4-hydroxy-tetrahydrodipicolinate synthase [Sphingobacteriales bacterium]|nr:MAG: 4-hydroxy-tetrahydrodipicolinate synthase [Sphingobacteriales bacterium]TAF79078.1 MAG: 4-hydroxy-tetrahydrodipicolinate synthase [Sphingobacteriales bacterium]
MINLKGTGVALITPFLANLEIDYASLERCIEHILKGSVEYIVVLGTTGETATLTDKEKETIFTFTTKIVNNRVPLVAGIGGNNTAEIVKQVNNFNTPGYVAILSVSPYYNKPTQEGIYQHYKAVADASLLPIILYNVPPRTGMNISAETTLRLAINVNNIIGIKEASGNFEQINEILEKKPANFQLVSGDDPISLPMIALGADGIISVIANAIPAQFSHMVRNCLAGNFNEAKPAHYSFLPFTRLCFADGNPAGIKAAMQHLNLCNDYLRLPLVNVTQPTREKLLVEINKIKNV